MKQFVERLVITAPFRQIYHLETNILLQYNCLDPLNRINIYGSDI